MLNLQRGQRRICLWTTIQWLRTVMIMPQLNIHSGTKKCIYCNMHFTLLYFKAIEWSKQTQYKINTSNQLRMLLRIKATHVFVWRAAYQHLWFYTVFCFSVICHEPRHLESLCVCVPRYRFIGITIAENLFWSSQITAVAKKKHRKVSTSYGNVVRLDSRARFGSAITEEQKKASRLEI